MPENKPTQVVAFLADGTIQIPVTEGDYSVTNSAGESIGSMVISATPSDFARAAINKPRTATAYLQYLVANSIKAPWDKEGFYSINQRAKIAAEFWGMYDMLIPDVNLSTATPQEIHNWNLKRWKAMNIAGVPCQESEIFSCMMARPAQKRYEQERPEKNIFALMRRSKRLSEGGFHKQPKKRR